MLSLSTVQQKDKSGFTLIEILVVITLIGIITVFATTFFITTIDQYFALQQNATAFNDLSSHYQRLANVIRGITGINSAAANDLNIYAYFYPNDTYVSLVHYYISGGKLLADVTPMTANPPSGTPITANKKTYTIIDQFVSISGVDTFVYLDAGNATLASPVSSLNSIKAIKVNLAVPSKAPTNTNQSLTLQLSLRNRKTNL